MPRLVHTPPKLRLHKGSGQFVVTIDGEDTYLGRSKPDARRKYRKLIAEWEAAGAATLAGDSTIAELCIDYWHFAIDDYGEGSGSLERIRQALRWLRNSGEARRVADFDSARLLDVQSAMVKAGKGRKYINYLIGTIKRIFRWAVVKKKAAQSQWHELSCVEPIPMGRTRAKEYGKIDAVSDADFEETLPELNKVLADLLRVIRLTGMRPGEACQLRPCDIERSGAVWVFKPERHKNQWRGKDRRVAIGPQAQAILSPYLQREPEAYCFSPREAVDSHHAKRTAARKTPLGYGNGPGKRSNPKQQPGDCYKPGALSVAIKRAVDRINAPRIKRNETLPEAERTPLLKHWRANQLRHAAATAIRKTHGLEAVQVVLGHSHAKTSEIYGEADAALAASVIGKIG